LSVDSVGLHPLQEKAALLEAALDRPVVFAREQAGDSSAVGIRRFRRNDVVGLASAEQSLTRVADHHPVLGILHGIVVYGGADARNR